MKEYLPYIVTVLCALISGLISYYASRKQAKTDLQKLEKQHQHDIEKEREKFAMEKEKWNWSKNISSNFCRNSLKTN